MTRQEVLALLAELMGAYPNAHKIIQNPQATARIWEIMFAEDEAQEVYKAARYHISTNKYFPTPADIREAMKKSRFLYPDYSPRLASGQEEEQMDEEEWNEILMALDFIP